MTDTLVLMHTHDPRLCAIWRMKVRWMMDTLVLTHTHDPRLCAIWRIKVRWMMDTLHMHDPRLCAIWRMKVRWMPHSVMCTGSGNSVTNVLVTVVTVILVVLSTTQKYSYLRIDRKEGKVGSRKDRNDTWKKRKLKALAGPHPHPQRDPILFSNTFSPKKRPHWRSASSPHPQTGNPGPAPEKGRKGMSKRYIA